MKIAIFTNNYLPNPYGVTTSIESFRKEFQKKGHTVYVFAPDNKDYKDKNKNVFRYHSLDIKYKIRFPLPVPYSRKIDKIIEELDIDIIHAQHPNLLGSAAMKWALIKNIPLVFTWHTIYDKYTHYTPLLPQKLSAKWIIRNSVKYANRVDKIIIPTNAVKKIIQNWGVANKNIETIPTGVDTSMFLNPDSEKVREELKINKDKKIVLSISRLTEEKNVFFLVKEMAKVLKNNPEVVFVLGGDGYLKDELIQIANQSKISEQVFFVGLIEKGELKNYMDLADIFVYASKSETQGAIVTESMYMGLPIVAVDALGVGDLIIDGKTGLLSTDRGNDFSKRVEKLLSNEKLMKSLGENAKKEAQEKYIGKICAEKMLKVYEELVNKNLGF